MYSGTTFRNASGNIAGVHQKIDRIARRNLKKLPGVGPGFPTAKQILHFEGLNGPDGIKRKSPSVDEPWHYIDPSDPSDIALLDMIDDHVKNLAAALSIRNDSRSSFEAAWLAHAITDGLTPAHHYPLSKKIEELWGKPKEERLSIVDKNIIRAATARETVGKNWEYWGAKGVFITHIMFELGVAASIQAVKYDKVGLGIESIERAEGQTLREVFTEEMYHIYSLNMYERFWKKGWTARMARESRQELVPRIARVVTLAWYRAYQESGL